ncbi:MAG: hypothetical protein Q9218_005787 [Villophora microphyllina]
MASTDRSKRRFRDRLPFKNHRKGDGQSLNALVPTTPFGVKSQAATSHTHDPEKVFSEASQTAQESKADHSLWALAYKDLAKSNPKLNQQLHDCLGIRLIADSAGDPVYSDINRIVQDALEEIDKASKAKEHSKIALAAGQYSKKAIPIIIASKDLIASVASANPYAALAWSGVSLLLPESEAAEKGLEYVVVLMEVYEWHEKTYLLHNALPDLQRLMIRLYVLLLEYQALLLVNLHKRAPAQWARAVFNSGDWSTRVKDIQSQDAHCRDLTNAIDGKRTVEWRDEERRWQRELLQQPRQDEENRHIRMLYSNYEQGKNVNPERIQGTCKWFLNHVGFLAWRKAQRSSLLWLSADPGCGKSVLAKYLIDRRGEVLTVNTQSPTVCYFFFKDGDVDRNNAPQALCAILHQLILQKPELYKYAKEDFLKKSEKFLTDLDALWDMFTRAVDDPSNDEILCVLDALDECQERSRTELIARIVQLFRHQPPIGDGKPILKFLVTSRPEIDIIRDFKALISKHSEIRLRGEEESEQISEEIDLVIRYKIEELGKRLDLSESDKSTLQENLSRIPHRTYLWLYLMFDDLSRRLDLTRDDIVAIARTIPKDVDQAYTAILEKSPDDRKARKLLHIVLAAVRPLSIQEINVAMVIREQTPPYADLDIWKPATAAERIKNICGLFVSVVDSKVYLIHQTAREFLVGEERKGWRGSFSLTQSNLILGEICVWYVRLSDLGDLSPTMPYDDLKRRAFLELEKSYIFLRYAAAHWHTHLRPAEGLARTALVETVALHVCDTRSASFALWSYWFLASPGYYDNILPSQGSPNLMVAAHLGLVRVVARLLEDEDVQVNWVDPRAGTALCSAALQGHHAVTELLLGCKDVLPNLPDGEGRTPLFWAVRNGHQETTMLFLKHDAVQVDIQDNLGLTPLNVAAYNGYEAIVKMLLERNVRVNLGAEEGYTPLIYAILGGKTAVVKLLLERIDVQPDLSDSYGCTPLAHAAAQGNVAVVEFLIGRDDVQADSRDEDALTPLSYAARDGHTEIVRIILQRGVQIDSKGRWGRTPLSYAAAEGHNRTVQLLLDGGARVDLEDRDGKTALMYAAQRGRKVTIVEMLLERGARVNSEDQKGKTALMYAADSGTEEVVKILLDRDAHVDYQDQNGETALFYAAASGEEAVVTLLLENGSRIMHRSKSGATALSLAKKHCKKYEDNLVDEDYFNKEYERQILPRIEAVVRLLERHLAQHQDAEDT